MSEQAPRHRPGARAAAFLARDHRSPKNADEVAGLESFAYGKPPHDTRAVGSQSRGDAAKGVVTALRAPGAPPDVERPGPVSFDATA
jgi:hypothetical protein